MTEWIEEFVDLRQEYTGEPLSEHDAHADPLDQFRAWWDQAIVAKIPLANAMALATATSDGRPSVRIVLLKAFDHRGFVFFTNYDSRKCLELQKNPHASLNLWWREQSRQIRIDGSVERIAPSDSDSYFASRPMASNVSALASVQSAVVDSRQTLESAVREVEQRATSGLSRPSNWGGLRLVPLEYEFWQGREDRLHDRLRYRRASDQWHCDRLAP